LLGNSAFHHDRQNASFSNNPQNSQQLLGILMHQDKKISSTLGSGNLGGQKKASLKAHHQQQLSQPADLGYVKQFMASDKQSSNGMVLGVSGVNASQQKQSAPMKPMNGYSTQQQFNQFTSL
jgi:hypothetical protein